jgi:ABC-2 type transport system ATP-binding protein
MVENLMNKILEIKQVSKSYGHFKALNSISMDIVSGQFVGLLGPNGAGKTTLFQLLSGLFTADTGTITVNKHDMSKQAVSALGKLGIVFQQPALDLDLTVKANLDYHARLHGINGLETKIRINEELEQLGMLDSLNKVCRSLSGGNRRKIELARALLHRPDLLLMDEATVGLDPASRKQLLNKVHNLCSERGLAVLWATHLIEEAETAHQIVILHQGNILTKGTPVDICNENGAQTLTETFIHLTKVTGEEDDSSH